MKHLILILFLVLLNADLFAQAPDTLWTKTFGGSAIDCGYSVKQTSDGGYVITGFTESVGASGRDVWLIKTDTNGDTLWTKTFGGSDFDEGNSVQQTIDGGYIITGSTNSFGAGNSDVWLIKTDTSGDTLWTKAFGGSLIDWGNSVQQTSDSGYIITGYTRSFGAGGNDVWLIKTDANGDTLWAKTFGGSGINEVGNSVQQTSDSGYIITGSRGADLYLIKTDSNGNTVWTKIYGGSGSQTGYSVQQSTDGGYIIAGRSYTTSIARLLKTDVNGDTVWTKTFEEAQGFSVHQTTDGGYIMAGHKRSYVSGYSDVWLIKTDANGDSLWTKTLLGSNSDAGYSVKQTSDGGYIITGSTNSFGAGNSDVWLIRLAPDVTAIDETPKAFINDYRLQQNYPNPFNPSTK